MAEGDYDDLLTEINSDCPLYDDGFILRSVEDDVDGNYMIFNTYTSDEDLIEGLDDNSSWAEEYILEEIGYFLDFYDFSDVCSILDSSQRGIKINITDDRSYYELKCTYDEMVDVYSESY